MGLREDVLPAFRRSHWCHYRHPSLDDGWLFGGGFGRCYSAGVRLVGDLDSIKADGSTLEEAIEALWAKLAPEGKRPTWWGTAPVELKVDG